MALALDEKINVLEISPLLDYAGMARNMMSFAKRLNPNLFKVSVLGYRGGGCQEEVLRQNKIDYLVGSDLPKIVEFAEQQRIDLVHIHRSGKTIPLETEILKTLAKVNNRLLIIETNIFGQFDPVNNSKISCHLFQSMMHIHERYLKSAQENFDFSKHKTFYCTVEADDFSKYTLTPEQIASYKEKLGIKPDEFVIGKSARPDLAKWSDLVLEMAPKAFKMMPKLKFIIMGLPESRRKIIKKKWWADKIIVLPVTIEQASLHAFYQSLDLLVHNSKIGECNSNTLNEAIFWGKPIVTNSTPRRDNGQLEQVHHMENGLIANYPQTFARAIKYLYDNQAVGQKMGELGRAMVLDKYSPVKRTRELEKLFVEKLLKNGKKFPAEIIEYYNKILYYPSEQEIVEYKKEYQNRLKLSFGSLTGFESLENISRWPRRFYYKGRDFLEHRFGISL